jgi:Fe-S cluster assembly protein SufD
VVIRPLTEVSADLALLGQTVPGRHGLFEALNGAAWTAGVMVKLPRGLDLAEPLRVLVPATEPDHLPRLLIVVEDGASGTVVQEHIGGGDQTRVIGVTEVLVGPAARLDHVLLQQWQRGVRAHLTSRGRVARDGRLFTALAAFGGSQVKLDLGAVLAGPGAQSELAGVALTEGKQHCDHHTEHRHLAPHTWSNLDFKVALSGRSRSVYTGLIRIETAAPHSEAYQENRNLLLSDRCRADTIPELEILTDEVSCSHGATAAPVAPEQLFYLASRGLPPREALQLVVRGFLEETLRRIPEQLRGGIEELVRQRLSRLAEVVT